MNTSKFDPKTCEIIDLVINHKKKLINKDFIEVADNNRILLTVGEINNDHISLDIEAQGNEWLQKLTNTLTFLNQVLGKNVDYLVVRTFKYIPYVTFDVDVFIPNKDFERAIILFKENGCKVESHDNSLGGRIPRAQVNVRKQDLLTIDLHQDFTWQKRQFLNPNIMFQDAQIKEINGISVKIPSSEVELLLCMADITHERFNITLLDLIWLHGLSGQIKHWDLIFKQVRQYGWFNTFYYTGKIINAMTHSIYNKEVIPEIGKSDGNYSLPYLLPVWICWLSYLENFKSTKKIPTTSLAYMHFNKFRYYLSNKTKMPYYDHWYKEKK